MILFQAPPPSHLPSHIYLTSCMWLSQAFPLHFCTLQALKNWKREWPWNEAKLLVGILAASVDKHLLCFIDSNWMPWSTTYANCKTSYLKGRQDSSGHSQDICDMICDQPKVVWMIECCEEWNHMLLLAIRKFQFPLHMARFMPRYAIWIYL